MTTDKFDLHTIDYSVQGWDTILATDMEKLDDVIPSRVLGTLGESVSAYDAVYLKAADGKFWKAMADGSKQPCQGIALEAGDADDSIRIVTLGEVANVAWAWTIGADIYLDGSTAGALTQVQPAANVQVVGYALNASTMFVRPQTTQSASGGGGFIELTTAAGESIAAGDVIGFYPSGARKGFGIRTGTVATKIINEACAYGHSCCALDNDLFLITYRKTGDTKLYGMAVKRNADMTLTLGAEATIANYAVQVGVRSCAMSTTKFMVFWCENAAAQKGFCLAGTIDAGTLAITLGAEAQFHANKTSKNPYSEYAMDAKKLDTDKFIIVYSDGDDSNYGHCVVGTLAGTVVTVDTAHDIKWSGTSVVDDLALIAHSATKAVVWYEVAGPTIYEMLITIATTTPTAGAAYGSVGSFALTGNRGELLSSQINIFMAGGLATIPLFLAGSYYGWGAYQISWGIPCPYTLQAAIPAGIHGFGELPFDFVVACWSESGNTAIKAALFKCAHAYWYQVGSTLTTDATAVGSSYYSAMTPNRQYIFMSYPDSADANKVYGYIYEVGYPVGIAADANNGGTALNIIQKALSANHSALVAGLAYYAQPDGSLLSTMNGVFAGVAQAADTLIVDWLRGVQ